MDVYFKNNKNNNKESYFRQHPPTMLRQFIEKLSADMGFEQGLEANEDGSYSLRLEPDIDVTLKEDAESNIQFYSKIAELPSVNVEDYLLKLMVANLFGRETGGAALGLDSEGKKVVLSHFLLKEENYKVFHEQLEDFANYAETWRLETKEFIEQQETEE